MTGGSIRHGADSEDARQGRPRLRRRRSLRVGNHRRMDATEVTNLRDYATRVLDGRSSRLGSTVDPRSGSVARWRSEVAAELVHS